jgi:hypothetical protein
MLFDFKISKPTSMNAYELHCMIEGLFKEDEGRHLFCDRGDHVLVRSLNVKCGELEGDALKMPSLNDVVFVELRASCFVSGGGKKFFLKQGDWRSRHEWLEKKATQNGFCVLTTTCRSEIAKVQKPKAEFTLDCTDFTACIKIKDQEKFISALQNGIGSKGRAFGFGMLVL